MKRSLPNWKPVPISSLKTESTLENCDVFLESGQAYRKGYVTLEKETHFEDSLNILSMS